MPGRKRKRDYAKEYREYHATEEQKKRRAERNRANREARREGRIRKGDGREVHHVNAPRKGSLSRSSTRVVPQRVNARIQPKRK
jgi:hypothetical protein